MPLRSFETVINYIEGTETVTGLQVRVDLKRGGNDIVERVLNEEMRSLRIEPHAVCPAWSYTIHPEPEPAPNNHFI
ncbi:ISAzo13-like element transposase-related protein [Noviherbaspirillum sp. 1P10PC]|uniref:ISAzo13-like element transposase-related protein n=1 Tax=Noviherbaspirillum sp. 1P10PC TaxID=3132292 RepID=UPI00399F3577